MRRVVDVVGALLVGLVCSPLIVLAALALLATSGPPVLFRQERVGRDGRPFEIVKFRTMRPATGPEDEDDDLGRSTRLGRLLRATSVDELPQLWNILRGDMAFIGPRPTIPEHVVHYTAHQRRRLEVRPGITGWAQVNGRNSLSWPARIELDIWYVDHRSLLLELRILARTARCLVWPSGVMGEGGINPDFPVPVLPVVPPTPTPSAPAGPVDMPSPRSVHDRLRPDPPVRRGAAS